LEVHQEYHTQITTEQNAYAKRADLPLTPGRAQGIRRQVQPFKKLTTRFIAGETIEEAIAAIREVNAHGCTASFDHLNEGVTTLRRPRPK
jgi:hypothetical protein